MTSFLTSTEAIVIEIIVATFFALFASIHIHSNYKKYSNKPLSFLSARASQHWFKVTVSLLATYIGNWAIFLPVDFGAYFGILGIISYTISSIVPIIIISYLGPFIAQRTSDSDFTSADYFHKRYGIIFHILLSILSILYMWVFLCTELTTVALTLTSLTNGAVSPFISILPVATSTLIYTAYSGLPASLFTDQFQGILVLLMGIIIVCSSIVVQPLDKTFWDSISFAPSGSWLASISLILTVYPSELLNQSCWQRILSCRSTSDIRKTCWITSLFLSIVLLIFGFLGVLAGFIYPQGFASGQIFGLVSPLENWILIIILIFAVALVSSSVDSLQNGMAALLGSHLVRYNQSMNWARFCTVLINIPAVIVASMGLNIFNLFYTANLLCLGVAAPQLMSFSSYWTTLGALLGSLVGILTIPVVGWIYTKSFIQSIFYFYPSDISHISYIIIGIMSPILSACTTATFSWLDRKYNILHKPENNLSIKRTA